MTSRPSGLPRQNKIPVAKWGFIFIYIFSQERVDLLTFKIKIARDNKEKNNKNAARNIWSNNVNLSVLCISKSISSISNQLYLHFHSFGKMWISEVLFKFPFAMCIEDISRKWVKSLIIKTFKLLYSFNNRIARNRGIIYLPKLE